MLLVINNRLILRSSLDLKNCTSVCNRKLIKVWEVIFFLSHLDFLKKN